LNPAHPRIANQLWIKRKQAIGCFRISARRGLPVDEALLAVELSDGIDVANKFIASSERPTEFDLQVLFGHPDPVIRGEFLKQMDASVGEPILGITFAVFKRSITERTPSVAPQRSAILGCRPNAIPLVRADQFDPALLDRRNFSNSGSGYGAANGAHCWEDYGIGQRLESREATGIRGEKANGDGNLSRMSGTLGLGDTLTPDGTAQWFHFPFIFQLRIVGNRLSAANPGVRNR